jgi:hypothetical protein
LKPREQVGDVAVARLDLVGREQVVEQRGLVAVRQRGQCRGVGQRRLAVARCRRHQHELAQPLRVLDREALGDHAAHRPADHVRAAQA